MKSAPTVLPTPPVSDIWAQEKETKQSVGINLRVPQELRDELQKLCEARGIEMSKVIRRLIERELEANR